jgi:hypothetical protein
MDGVRGASPACHFHKFQNIESLRTQALAPNAGTALLRVEVQNLIRQNYERQGSALLGFRNVPSGARPYELRMIT